MGTFGWGTRSKNKYGARKVTHDSYNFDSQLEREVYKILKLREKAGELSDLKVKDKVYLTNAEISYNADFTAIDASGIRFWIEAKGIDGERWRIIKKLWTRYGPGNLEVWKGTHQRPFLHETIQGNPGR